MPWIVGGAIAGGALINANSANKAANAQTKAADAAIAEQRRQFDLTRQDTAPYRTAGTAALAKLSQGLGLSGAPSVDTNDPRYQALYSQAVNDFDKLHQDKYGFGIYDERRGYGGVLPQNEVDILNRQAMDKYLAQYGQPAAAPASTPGFGTGDLTRRFTMEDFNNDPVVQAGFKFGLDEGTKGVNRAFGASGLGRSGAAVKAATRFATDYASTKANDSYNRFVNDQTNLFNKYATTAGIGQTATNTVTNAGANTANNVGNLIVGAGNARGAAAIAGGNAITNAVNTGVNYYSGQNTLDKILNSGMGVSVPAPRRAFSIEDPMANVG